MPHETAFESICSTWSQRRACAHLVVSPWLAQEGAEAVACREEELLPLPEGLCPEEFVAIADYAATDETQVPVIMPSLMD